ncbi:MAG TPA: kelch repeat-containing protein [Planctomycetaceae bacterium]|nr:kelch repeat-containing protein [Planctomycetaceae bacterium]
MDHDTHNEGWGLLAAVIAVGAVIVAFPSFADSQDLPYRWDKPVQWGEKEGPEAREHGAVIVDEDRDRAILISGSGYEPYLTPLADVWQFSLKTDKWSPLKSTGPTPSGGSRRVAQLPAKKVAYLFGGYGVGSKTHNELVRVDFAEESPAFAEVPQDNPPSARALHAFVYDAKLDKFVLFGGVTLGDAGEKIYNDVWTMKLADGRARWIKLDVEMPPLPRYGFFYGYDPELGRLIVFSGAQGTAEVNPARDTWLLSVRAEPPSWKQLGETRPPGRRNGCFVYDPAEQRLFVFGGTKDAKSAEPDLWVFDARSSRERWKGYVFPHGPPSRSSGFGFHDRARKRILLGFGNAAKPYRDLYPLKY